MANASFYRAQAQEMLDAAQQASDETQRARFMALAARWHQLALEQEALDEPTPAPDAPDGSEP